jgi:HK97 family phage portal protein
MNIRDLALTFLDGIGPITRSDPHADFLPSYDEQMAAIWSRHRRRTPWRISSVKEALGVPAIFSAVSLIADTVGSLSLEAYRQGVLLDQQDTPRLVQRPNPFSTPRAFFRDTAYYLATRGEAWWWIARRDIDDVPLSLYPIPPWEINVTINDRNRLRPTIKWGDTAIDNEDIRQITYLPADDGLRGVGPLQVCGAATSVSVEADEWAANFFSGSIPSIIGTTEQELTEDELKSLDKQWNEKPPNTPRWMHSGITMTDAPYDAEKAQLTESRQHQVGEAARMFNVPGSLIEYQMGGSSLTYQNQEMIWGDFQRRCLSPHYLEPIEQEMSDLLTRSTAARFNLKQLLRADPKTRAEVYEKMVPLGIMSADEARVAEGLNPGAVDYASTPPQLPAAIPALLPVNRTAHQVRCPSGHLLAEMASPPYRFTCPRCKRSVVAA